MVEAAGIEPAASGLKSGFLSLTGRIPEGNYFPSLIHDIPQALYRSVKILLRRPDIRMSHQFPGLKNIGAAFHNLSAKRMP